jgi:hypothetical protein
MRVILAGVEANAPSAASGLADLSCKLAWHDVSAEIEFIPPATGAAGELIPASAGALPAQ